MSFTLTTEVLSNLGNDDAHYGFPVMFDGLEWRLTAKLVEPNVIEASVECSQVAKTVPVARDVSVTYVTIPPSSAEQYNSCKLGSNTRKLSTSEVIKLSYDCYLVAATVTLEHFGVADQAATLTDEAAPSSEPQSSADSENRLKELNERIIKESKEYFESQGLSWDLEDMMKKIEERMQGRTIQNMEKMSADELEKKVLDMVGIDWAPDWLQACVTDKGEKLMEGLVRQDKQRLKNLEQRRKNLTADQLQQNLELSRQIFERLKVREKLSAEIDNHAQLEAVNQHQNVQDDDEMVRKEDERLAELLNELKMAEVEKLVKEKEVENLEELEAKKVAHTNKFSEDLKKGAKPMEMATQMFGLLHASNQKLMESEKKVELLQQIVSETEAEMWNLKQKNEELKGKVEHLEDSLDLEKRIRIDAESDVIVLEKKIRKLEQTKK